jgi:hypothetical protein
MDNMSMLSSTTILFLLLLLPTQPMVNAKVIHVLMVSTSHLEVLLVIQLGTTK